LAIVVPYGALQIQTVGHVGPQFVGLLLDWIGEIRAGKKKRRWPSSIMPVAERPRWCRAVHDAYDTGFVILPAHATITDHRRN